MVQNVNIPKDLSGGVADRFSLSIESITLENGLTVHPPSNGVTVVVGGNNVGKSTLLRQVANLAARDRGAAIEPTRWQLVKEVKFGTTGNAADLCSWLADHVGVHVEHGATWFGLRGQQRASEHDIRNTYFDFENTGIMDRLGSSLAGVLTLYADPWQRGGAIHPLQMRDYTGDSPQGIMHRLEDSLETLNEVRRICREVFRLDLTLDTLARMVQLRVGKVEIDAPPADAITPEYREAVAALAPLTEQGDGIKNFIALILPLVTAEQPIVLIDEPEAFLHPPQASALGRILGQLAKKKGVQVILATHDKNLLMGLLESEAEVSVLRLDRDLKGASRAHQLAVEDVKDLWGDPLLRYTNALDSLFHRLTIVAEADQDCRFYSAALSEYEPQVDVPIPPSDVLFVPSYGKAAMHKLIRVLQAIHVPVVAVPDIDILNDSSNISRLVTSFQKDWKPLERNYRVATQPFRQPQRVATLGDVVSAVNSIFAGREGEAFTGQARKDVLAQLRAQESPWAELKRYGESAFSGEAAVAARDLLAQLDKIGIVLVRVGELERFAPALGVAKGAGWLNEALRAGAHKTELVRQHIKRCLAGLRTAT
ncbi:ATP-dependent endonuclease [Streptomyces sp. NPDC059374]|uniref:ATP-dependent nuclease n=1 Tax=Streptomyces sp. NPDC059374 TaxID=3346814 RepID=UPI00367DE38D